MCDECIKQTLSPADSCRYETAMDNGCVAHTGKHFLQMDGTWIKHNIIKEI
jgi:hypothetical protein